MHYDTEAFRTLITQLSFEQGILPEIIEKDYFVTLMLQEIAEKQKHYDVFFKGGTALYKALKSINRFSEDIYLTFNDKNFNSKTAKKKALKRVTSEYTSLEINLDDSEFKISFESIIESFKVIFNELSEFNSNVGE